MVFDEKRLSLNYEYSISNIRDKKNDLLEVIFFV